MNNGGTHCRLRGRGLRHTDKKKGRKKKKDFAPKKESRRTKGKQVTKDEDTKYPLTDGGLPDYDRGKPRK